MRDRILDKFNRNIARAQNLVSLYTKRLAGLGQGRRPVHSSDVLRAAVVLLHATLEEFLRGLALWKLPAANAEVLDGIPLAGSPGRPEKFLLGRLAQYRAMNVGNLIDKSIEEHLSRSSYNSTDEITVLLRDLGIEVDAISDRFADIQELMQRRHHIVHRADADERPGRGHHEAKSIGRGAVGRWIEAVHEFADSVLAALPDG